MFDQSGDYSLLVIRFQARYIFYFIRQSNFLLLYAAAFLQNFITFTTVPCADFFITILKSFEPDPGGQAAFITDHHNVGHVYHGFFFHDSALGVFSGGF